MYIEPTQAQPVGLAVWPLVDGRIAVNIAQGGQVTCHYLAHRRDVPGGQTPQLIEQILSLLPSRYSCLDVEGAYRSLLFSLGYAAQGDTIQRTASNKQEARRLLRLATKALPKERLRYPSTRWCVVPPGFDAYTVAISASVAAPGGTWAYVTGGGWYTTGKVDAMSLPAVEWIGGGRALNLFPPHAAVTLSITNAQVVGLMRAVVQGYSPDCPDWLTKAAFNQGRQSIKRLEVRPHIKLVRRGACPLVSLADQLCQKVSP